MVDENYCSSLSPSCLLRCCVSILSLIGHRVENLILSLIDNGIVTGMAFLIENAQARISIVALGIYIFIIAYSPGMGTSVIPDYAVEYWNDRATLLTIAINDRPGAVFI